MADPNQPSSSSQYDQSDSGARTERKRTIEQGVEYLKLVKDTFGSRNDCRYRGFLRVMKDYKEGTNGIVENSIAPVAHSGSTLQILAWNGNRISFPFHVISLVKVMFEGHHELLMGFNILLPRGYSINSVAPKKDPPAKLETFAAVINLVNKVKTRSQDDKHCYSAFLDALNNYRRNPCTNTLLKEMSIVFQDYPDLLADFCRFSEIIIPTTQ